MIEAMQTVLFLIGALLFSYTIPSVIFVIGLQSKFNDIKLNNAGLGMQISIFLMLQYII